MCAQFLIKTKISELRRLFGITIPSPFPDDTEIEERIVPHKLAPVILNRHKKRELHSMQFSLLPSWSPERKIKFATHNARLDTIFVKKTWRGPFTRQRALVPLSDFIEPIYVHDLKGNMVRFHQRESKLLVAAAVYDEWLDKSTGEIVESFAIITDDPPPFVDQIGHDRCPLFLKESAWEKWLDEGEKNPFQLTQLLRNNVQAVDFGVSVDRPMAKGWENRIPKD